MISTVKEIYNHIEKAEVISKELTDILLELDTTNSRVTQASLNDMLIALHNRINKDGSVKFELLDTDVDVESFIHWIESEFTLYSTNLVKETIK